MTLLGSLAAAYAAAPVLQPSAVPAWLALGRDSVLMADRIRQRFEIHYTSDQPYENALSMLRDIANRVCVISTAYMTHPVWDTETNIAFRIVHDVMGHGPSGGDFTWGGELLACMFHQRVVTKAALSALRTECLGQVAYQQMTGRFGVQKVAIL